MSKKLSHLICWGSMTTIALIVIVLFYFLFDIAGFAELAQSSLELPIYWATVEQWQWYLLLASTTVYLAIGLLGLYFLHLAFRKIAMGELFNLTNSLNIRRFSILLLVQALAKPIYFSATSVLLSLNHPAGEKVFSLSFGSQELTLLALAMIFWVVSDVLVAGSRLQSENQQFV